MAETSFDILIIGSGPGGYVAAIRAAQLGLKTAIVERSYLGGICLNWGCIPTKALLRSAEIFHYMQHAKDYGLSADNVRFDPKAVVARSRAVAKRLNDGVGFLMKKNKIDVIWGEATIEAPGKVTVKARRPKHRRMLSVLEIIRPSISSSRPARVCARRPALNPIRSWVWTYFEAAPDRMPKSLLVIGSGAIGSSLLHLPHPRCGRSPWLRCCRKFCRWRTPRSRPLPARVLEKQGIKIITGAKVTKLDKKSDP